MAQLGTRCCTFRRPRRRRSCSNSSTNRCLSARARSLATPMWTLSNHVTPTGLRLRRPSRNCLPTGNSARSLWRTHTPGPPRQPTPRLRSHAHHLLRQLASPAWAARKA
eukprot:10995828-Lingulodinium_polyedra.AAC.1